MENDNRIDAFKVRRKVFAKYAEGSLERKVILKEAKMMEFNHVSKSMRMLSPETFELLKEANSKVMLKEGSTILFLGAILAGAISVHIKYFGAFSLFQTFGMAGAETHLTTEIILATLRLYEVAGAFRLVKSEYNRMREKMEKIISDMGGLS